MAQSCGDLGEIQREKGFLFVCLPTNVIYGGCFHKPQYFIYTVDTTAASILGIA